MNVRSRRTAESAGRESHQVLGRRYELGRLLGCGAMANVYRARDRMTGGDVAVKVFRPGLEFADAHKRRQRELTVLSSLRHASLVAVLDAHLGDEESAPAYLVVELVDGPTLGRHLREEVLDEAQVAALGAALCEALSYVHERGVVHRDIKPANILLASREDAFDLGPKLTDFGLARALDSTRMTGDGQIVGTANYLSPEQVTGSDIGTASDVYSLGLVLIQALSGAIAFPGHGVEAALARLHRDPVLPAVGTPELADLLARMTDRDAARRPSAAVAGAQLSEIAESTLGSDIFAIEAGETARAGRSGRAAPRDVRPDAARARRRFGVLAAAAAVVAAVMTSGVILAGQDGTGSDAAQIAAPPSSQPDATVGRSPVADESSASPSRSATPTTPPTRTSAVAQPVAKRHTVTAEARNTPTLPPPVRTVTHRSHPASTASRRPTSSHSARRSRPARKSSPAARARAHARAQAQARIRAAVHARAAKRHHPRAHPPARGLQQQQR